MSDPEHEGSGVFEAIANWMKTYREAIGLRGELAECGAQEVAAIARDVGVTPGELLAAVHKGPHAADELPRLLRALGVDPEKLASTDPGTMRSLQRICITCRHKRECRHDLAAGIAATHYYDYCPNAISLDALLHSKASLTKGTAR